MSGSDFSREIEAARKRKEILDKEEGIVANATVLNQVGAVVTNNLLELPR
jgi:hypothetical protein